MGVRNEEWVEDAMRRCDEVNRGRTRFCGAEVFIIWGAL